MPIFELKESDFAGYMPDDHVVEAEVTSVGLITREQFIDEKTGQPQQRVEFKFTVTDPDSPWDGTYLKGNTPTTFTTNENCKLRNWSQEILAAELPPGFKLNTDDLVGQRCRVVVDLQNWTDKEGNPRQTNKVKDVMRSRSAISNNDF